MSIVGLLLSAAIGISLGFFGGGGSILTVPLLVYVFGLDPKQAIASSLLIVGVASLTAAWQHWRAGNVRVRQGLLFAAAGMVGAYLGGRASAFLDGELLLLLLASMMLLTAGAMWRVRRGDVHAPPPPHAPWKLAAQGLAVGSFTGLVGAGGGFLIVPALALFAGLPMPAAVGTSLLVIVLNSAAAFAGYASHVVVDPSLVAAIAASAIAGSFAGARFTRIVNPASLRRAFAGFLLGMACLILVREGALVAQTAAAALPATLPQLLFALVALAIGIAAGRVSKRAALQTQEPLYGDGGGI